MSQSLSLWRQECAIMDRFDFEKIHKCMQALNWKWRGEEVTVEDLKICAEQLINYIKRDIEAGVDGAWLSVSTGGFKATGHLIQGDWRLTLEFIVAQWEGSPE
jgi:hypothetical protein